VIAQPRANLAVDGQPVPYTLATSVYTALFNLTGSPAVALPLGRSQEGLPFGVQVASRRWGDMELLAVARALSELTGPFQPPMGY